MTKRIPAPIAASLLGALTLALAGATAAAAQTPTPAPGATERQERMERMRERMTERMAERMQRTPPAPGIERILEQRTRLGLSNQQVSQLNTLRVQALESRQSRMATAARVRSDLAAGEITRAEAAARMEESRSAAPAGELQARIQEILTEEQRTQLQELRRGFAPGGEGMRRMRPAPGRPGMTRAPRGLRG